MTRGVAAALGIWTVVATVWAVFFSGGRVLECLGGPAITVDDCRAAYGLPPETGPDRFLAGPGVLIVALVVGWLTILFLARWRRRQRGGL